MDLSGAIERHWSHAVAIVGGLWLVFKEWRGSRRRAQHQEVADRAAQATAKLDLAKLAQEAAADVVQLLRAEVERLSDELDVVRERMVEMQAEPTRMMAEKDASYALLEGRNRQLLAENESLRRRLIALGETPPPPFNALEVHGAAEVAPMGGAPVIVGEN